MKSPSPPGDVSFSTAASKEDTTSECSSSKKESRSVSTASAHASWLFVTRRRPLGCPHRVPRPAPLRGWDVKSCAAGWRLSGDGGGLEGTWTRSSATSSSWSPGRTTTAYAILVKSPSPRSEGAGVSDHPPRVNLCSQHILRQAFTSECPHTPYEVLSREPNVLVL